MIAENVQMNSTAVFTLILLVWNMITLTLMGIDKP